MNPYCSSGFQGSSLLAIAANMAPRHNLPVCARRAVDAPAAAAPVYQ